MRILTSAIVGAALALALGWYFLRANPTAPELDAPIGETLAAETSSTKVLLAWNHGGEIGYGGGTPKAATHFIVCLYPSFSGQVCKFPNGIGADPDFSYIAALADFVRNPLPGVVGIFGGNDPYSYELEIDLPASLNDQNLTWTVGACSRQAIESCTFSQSARVEVLARNITAIDVSDNVSTANKRVDFDIEIENSGIIATGDFRLATSVYEILVDTGGAVLTDVNNTGSATNFEGAGLAMDDLVIMKDGAVQSIFLLDLVGEGQRNSGNVYAIVRPGSIPTFWSTDIRSIAAGTSALEYKPCPQSQRLQALCQVSVGHNDLPTGFAVISTVDAHGLIAEYDETDNRTMANNIVMFPPP